MKRILDFTLALIGLFLSLPLWVLLGFFVWLDDLGLVFYGQDRVGKDGRIFRSLKFRSLHNVEDQMRTTKLGRILRVSAIDELPQLWNILKGEMSFVGPRALMLVEVDSNEKEPRGLWEFEGFAERCRVRPGLTGVAQVLVSRDIPRSEKMKYDLWYIRNQSLRLDLRIMMLSLLISLKGAWEKKGDKLSRRILRDLAQT